MDGTIRFANGATPGPGSNYDQTRQPLRGKPGLLFYHEVVFDFKTLQLSLSNTSLAHLFFVPFPNLLMRVCTCVCVAVESTEREPGRGEPPPPESDQPAESAEPHTAREEHGEQRAVSPGAETLHVTAHNTCNTDNKLYII